MVKVALEIEEAWALMSSVLTRLLAEVELERRDRANIRRWKAEELRTGGEEMEALQGKLNRDLERLWESRRKSEIRRSDWR